MPDLGAVCVGARPYTASCAVAGNRLRCAGLAARALSGVRCMQLLPMDMPAELHRRGTDLPGGDMIVAKGPLVIMAHGLLALDPEARKACWIHSDAGDLDAAGAEAQLDRWARRAR